MNAEKENQAKEKWLDIPLPLYCEGRPHLRIFDFDNTLVNTHDRATGEVMWLEATGKEWPFAGWYGRKETLEAPFFPDPAPQELLIKEVFNAYQAEKDNPRMWDVLLTGRPIKLRRRIRAICEQYGLTFDEDYYRGMKGMSFSDDTFAIKADIIRQRLLHNKLETVEIWEDRPEHVGRFTALAGELKSLVGKGLEKVYVMDVPNNQRYEL